MSKIKNLLAGLAGAVALNILHESLKKTSSDMPRVDLLGEEALQKTIQYFGGNLDHKKDLYKATLAGDILGNTLYYSLIGAGNPKYLWPKVAMMGLSAGIGAVSLPEPMGLDPEPVAKNNQVKALTVSYYVLGAVVTGLALNLLKRY
ncbi:hypothetical protein [Pedobacter sp. MC2016-24]|uniref:hypothetical protein n=1 Tax=Pedobacter sp. MC2016-24 TaxID=2780090 RepID=UPI00187FC718|nr:hypothetical protein [Pedobacter sp. MC2016-24]MBE9597780.1 hypothetical protein [Pedobacter sp. MC2016-24]